MIVKVVFMSMLLMLFFVPAVVGIIVPVLIVVIGCAFAFCCCVCLVK